LGVNFRVNDDQGSTNQNSSAISIDENGNFVVTWGDRRNFYQDIYAQRFASNGTRLGENFKVNEASGVNPAIATNPGGSFVVVWGGVWPFIGGYVFAQRFAGDGTVLGGNLRVSTGVYPAISMDTAGNFVVTWWTDRRNGDLGVYAQRYVRDGTAIGINFKVSDGQGGRAPVVAVCGSGNFVVIWTDWRNGDSDIYAQHYASDGTPVGNNYKIIDDQGKADQWSPSIAVN
jgi:hypothetical protein